MPRLSRKKSASGIHHIMNRSISELTLFKDDKDKNKFLDILKKYQQIYLFSVYSFVLMDTHYHLQIFDNGANISKFMKSINQSYAQYYNKKYNRHGHVFADRFKSKPIEKDSYALVVSAYIHTNPKDIVGLSHIHKYKYSSLGTYINNRNTYSDIVDTNFILSYYNSKKYTARKKYAEFISQFSKCPNYELDECHFDKSDDYFYKPNKHLLVRNSNIDEIAKFVSLYTNSNFSINVKYNHENSKHRSLCVLLCRSLCNINLNTICKFFGNTTASNIWRLSQQGFKLLNNDVKYKNIINDFIEYNKTA